MTLAAASGSIAVEVATATARTRELRQLPFRRLSFGPRQRCAYQPPMHRTFVFNRTLLDLVVGGGWSFLDVLSRFFRERRYLNRWLVSKRLSSLDSNNFLRDVFGG
jgi:hypothetical protein